MAVYLRVLLILTGLTGIHSITTVSDVSVKTGGSISIPCLYDSQYRNHVKYLCEGYYFAYCTYAAKTNQQNSRKFSISDDKNQRIFTVTINDVSGANTYYWCVVEINNGGDVRQYFHLSVTGDRPSLSVDNQKVTGLIGGDITINCYYRNSGEMKWCKLGSSCVTSSSGSIGGTTGTINASVPNVFTVTMSGLKLESSGWYYCVKGDLQMPVHVTVLERPSTTTAESNHVTVLEQKGSVSVDLKKYVIPLSLLIFIVMVALFILFMLRRHKQKKTETPATRAAEEEITYSHVKHIKKPTNQRSDVANDVDVTYSSVVHTRKQHEQKRSDVANDVDVTYSSVVHTRKQHEQKRSDVANDVDVTYSSVVPKRKQHEQRVEENNDNVTYSTLA
ncbi:uncharacterized protein LOC131993912 [Centropristis striata]|uniref:uncharacterized protein LOC131993912 n=1 Tax=Centropristis striata TaxID=184440 RepID=UPI0027E191A3|nr:uncharacterized protein LOC131993912 [Centropristis striata]